MELVLLGLLTITMVGAFRLGPKLANGAADLMTCYSVVLLTLFINLVFPAIAEMVLLGGELPYAGPLSHSPAVYGAVLYIFLGLGFFMIPNILASRGGGRRPQRRSANKDPQANAPPRPHLSRNTYVFLIAAIAFGVVLKLVVMQQIGFGPELVARMSVSVRRNLMQTGAETAATQYLSLASLMADAAAAYLTAFAIKTRGRVLFWAAVTVGLVALSYVLTGKRSTVLMIVILPVIAFHYTRRPFTTKDLPIMVGGLLALGMASLLFRVFGPQTSRNYGIDIRNYHLSEGSYVKFYLFSPEFATFDMLVRAVAQGEEIVRMFGGAAATFYRINIEPLTAFIPRAIWSGKPTQFYDLSQGFYAITFSVPVTKDTPGFTATLIGYAVALGGPLAVAAAMGLLGWFCAWADRRFPGRTMADLAFRAFLALLVFHMFRQGSVGWVFMTMIQYCGIPMLVWMAALILSRRANTRPMRRQIPMPMQRPLR